MRTFLRAALTVLMVLALPVQGFAAAAMISCAPGHARMQAASGGDVGRAAHGGDSHRLGQVHSGGSAVGDPDESATGGAAAVAELAQLSELAKLDCSACASCCVAVAILPDAIAVPVSKMSPESIRLAAPPRPDPVVYRIEHPPRRLIG